MFGKDEAERREAATSSDTDGMELVELPAGLVVPGESKKKKIVAEFHTYYIREVHQGDFHSLKLTAAVMLCFAFLFMMLAVIGCEWSVAYV